VRFLAVQLENFRNYEAARLEPGEGLNLLVGPNAAGKTNLLEALAVLASGRSPRLKGAEVLVRRGAAVAHLRARVEGSPGEAHRVEVGLGRDGKRRIKLDGKPTRRLSELAGRLPLVQLFPEDLRMPAGSPSRRRAWLDALAALLVPGFVATRKAEERALRQRNAALKARRPAREIRALDGPFLGRAVEVLAARARAIEDLRRALGALPPSLESERLEVDYWAAGKTPGLLRTRLEERLVATAPDERRLLATQIGPHRDDCKIRIGGLPVSGNASRGQLRTLMLRLKLAEAEAVREVRRERPVLLLDDALSDMDTPRRRRTLGNLAQVGQVFLSVPEVPEARGGPKARVFVIRAGTLHTAEEE
jgi:DNA replication and repair protein RecF